MSDVLVRWKIRSAIMTPFGAMPRAAGDQDTMERRKATDLARCGFVEILGKPKDTVAEIAEIVDDDNAT